MEALETIKSRRSTRAFKDTMPDDELLGQILEAGQFAPSGGNCQFSHFLVVQDPKVLDELAALVQGEFAKMEALPSLYKSLKNAITRSKTGNYVFHYHAPVLVIALNRIDHGNAMADCACALENMMLAANALNLGSCWINQLRWLHQDPVIVEYLRGLGMEENECVYGALAVGYSDTVSGLPNREILPRTGNRITFVRLR